MKALVCLLNSQRDKNSKEEATVSIDPLDRKPVQYASNSRHTVGGSGLLNDQAFIEKHYRIAELAGIWGIGRETVRKIVKDEPGVIQIRQGRKKTHTTYSVPESVARRIHSRMSNVA
jgi:hypothetical protein